MVSFNAHLHYRFSQSTSSCLKLRLMSYLNCEKLRHERIEYHSKVTQLLNGQARIDQHLLVPISTFLHCIIA